jgi:DNA-binding transcriptional ArsR family regulator
MIEKRPKRVLPIDWLMKGLTDAACLSSLLIKMPLKYDARPETDERLNAVFSALADPTRRAILSRLRDGEASVKRLAEPFEMSLPAVSQHLKVLERAGLISRGREAQWRPARLDAAPIKEVAQWAYGFREYWQETFERLDDLLDELQTER